jgi:hypothetical protein
LKVFNFRLSIIWLGFHFDACPFTALRQSPGQLFIGQQAMSEVYIEQGWKIKAQL